MSYKTLLKKDAGLTQSSPKTFYLIDKWMYSKERKVAPLLLLNPVQDVAKQIKKETPAKKWLLKGEYTSRSTPDGPTIEFVQPRHAGAARAYLKKIEAGLERWVTLPEGVVESEVVTSDMMASDDSDSESVGEKSVESVTTKVPLPSTKLPVVEVKTVETAPPKPLTQKGPPPPVPARETKSDNNNVKPPAPQPVTAAKGSLFGAKPPPVPARSQVSKPGALPKIKRDLKTVALDKSDKGKLGNGSFGAVYEIPGGDGEGRKLAFKTFKASDKKAEEEMNREVDGYKKVGEHPNIVRCYGIQEVGGETGLVMEKIEGGKVQDAFDRLEDLKKVGQLSDQEYWGAVQHIIGGTLRGLAALEQANVVHSDIKEDNVMLDLNTFEAKLVDFGLATDTGSAPNKGHASYRPPERHVVDGATQASPEQDSYAVGQMLHKTAEGKTFTFHANANFQYGVFPGAKKYIEKDEETGEMKARALVPEEPGEKATEVGKFAKGYESHYVDFLNKLMHPDPSKRLKASEALEHPFLKNTLFEGGLDKTALINKLKPTTPVPTVAPAKSDTDTIKQRLEDLEPTYLEFLKFERRPDLHGVVNWAEVRRFHDSCRNFLQQQGKLAEAERALENFEVALPAAIKASREYIMRDFFPVGQAATWENQKLKPGKEFKAFLAAYRVAETDKSPKALSDLEAATRGYLAHWEQHSDRAKADSETKQKKQICEQTLVYLRGIRLLLAKK